MHIGPSPYGIFLIIQMQSDLNEDIYRDFETKEILVDISIAIV